LYRDIGAQLQPDTGLRCKRVRDQVQDLFGPHVHGPAEDFLGAVCIKKAACGKPMPTTVGEVRPLRVIHPSNEREISPLAG
jgi:hypothetical protein